MLKKQDLRPSLFNVNMHIRNQHALKRRKNINFGCGGGGARSGVVAHGLIEDIFRLQTKAVNLILTSHVSLSSYL